MASSSIKNTFAEIMAGKVKATVLRARVHNYPDSLTAALAPNNIPTQVFHNVIDACNRHLDIWHRYWDMRRRALGLEKMEVCDVFAPLAKPPRVTYKQAVRWIVEGLRPLGAGLCPHSEARADDRPLGGHLSQRGQARCGPTPPAHTAPSPTSS
jgi:oligoendopeptidase F